MNSSDLFSHFEQLGDEKLSVIRTAAFTPSSAKELRTWGITETSNMVGRSVQTLRALEKAKKIPTPEISKATKRRVYTLQHINMLRDYFGTRPSKPKGAEAATIAISNFKGGVWKTTTALHLSQYLALKGYKTLLVDCDSQASATQCFGYTPDDDIAENETLLPILCGESENIKDSIRETYWDGLDLIPANLSLYNAEFILPAKVERAKSEAQKLAKAREEERSKQRALGAEIPKKEQDRQDRQDREATKFDFWDVLNQSLSPIKNEYDFVIFDCPPSMGMISINSLFAANSIIIPIPPSMLDFTSTIQFFNMLSAVLDKIPGKNYDLVKLLITKSDKSENSKRLSRMIGDLYKEHILSTHMVSSEAIKKISTEMLSIYEIEGYAGSQKTFNRIRNAADEVNSEIEECIKILWEDSILNQQQSKKELEHG